mgnify:CR=1 FL=1
MREAMRSGWKASSASSLRANSGPAPSAAASRSPGPAGMRYSRFSFKKASYASASGSGWKYRPVQAESSCSRTAKQCVVTKLSASRTSGHQPLTISLASRVVPATRGSPSPGIF